MALPHQCKKTFRCTDYECQLWHPKQRLEKCPDGALCDQECPLLHPAKADKGKPCLNGACAEVVVNQPGGPAGPATSAMKAGPTYEMDPETARLIALMQQEDEQFARDREMALQMSGMSLGGNAPAKSSSGGAKEAKPSAPGEQYPPPKPTYKDILLPPGLTPEEEATQRLIARLQQEEEQAADDRRIAQEFQEKNGTFECVFCVEQLSNDDLFLVEGCGHQFCRVCAHRFIATAIRGGELPILCATCKVYNKDDVTEISRRSAEVVLHDDDLRILNNLEINKAMRANPNLRRCITPDCNGVAELEDGLKRFDCPICKKTHCVDCRANHDGDCEAYRRWRAENDNGDEAVRESFRHDGTKICPGCGHAVFKDAGCNKMLCNCGVYFCYLCATLIEGDPYKHFGGACPLFAIPPEV